MHKTFHDQLHVRHKTNMKNCLQTTTLKSIFSNHKEMTLVTNRKTHTHTQCVKKSFLTNSSQKSQENFLKIWMDITMKLQQTKKFTGCSDSSTKRYKVDLLTKKRKS